jgi:transposase
MERKRRRFTAEFKEEAVRLLVRSGRPLAQVARELGLGEQVLRNWKRALEHGSHGGNGSAAGHFTQEDENRRLRSELARVKEERDILKKATAFFARESR